MSPERFKLGIRTAFSRSVETGCHKVVLESPSLGVFKKHGDVALCAMVSGHGEGGLGLDWVILLDFSSLNDAVILSYFSPTLSDCWLSIQDNLQKAAFCYQQR